MPDIPPPWRSETPWQDAVLILALICTVIVIPAVAYLLTRNTGG